MTRSARIAVVMVTLVIIASWTTIVQTQSGGKIDQKVTDPQAAIKAAAAAFKQAKPLDNFAPKKTAWGDPDISGTYLTATYTPLQRPERLKDKPLFTEDEAINELARVIGQDAEVDPRNVHYDWKEYGMDGWQSPIRPSLRTSLIVDPPNGRIPPLTAEAEKRRADRAAAARLRAPEVAVRTKTKGDRLHVLGIPRIDLALVSYRTRVADTRPEVLDWGLPYELIVVGLYEE